jgi:hypothetical protein
MGQKLPLPLVEPVPIEDDFCTELVRIEPLRDGAVRLVWAVGQTLYEAGDAPVLVVKSKLVLQRADFRAAAALCARNVRAGR